MNTNIDF